MPKRGKAVRLKAKARPKWAMAAQIGDGERALARMLRQLAGKRRPEQVAAICLMHESLGRLVWRFREAHGWRFGKGKVLIPRNYFGSIKKRYGSLRLGRGDYEIIRLVSSEAGIDAIRQRGRMRRKPVPLTKAELGKLQVEMRAVLRRIFSA